MNKTKISLAVAVIFLSITGASYAADSTSTTETKTPLSQSTTSVQKNLTRDADSKGLSNASNRLETNQNKIKAHKSLRAEKRLSKSDKLAGKATE